MGKCCELRGAIGGKLHSLFGVTVDSRQKRTSKRDEAVSRRNER
jgi:hypothetical protein